MGKGNAAFRLALKMGQIIHQLPDDGNKAFQNCDPDEKVTQLMKLAFKQYTGETYTDQWYQENSKYM